MEEYIVVKAMKFAIVVNYSVKYSYGTVYSYYSVLLTKRLVWTKVQVTSGVKIIGDDSLFPLPTLFYPPPPLTLNIDVTAHPWHRYIIQDERQA